MSHPYAIASDGTRLFVADSYNARVLVFSTIPTTGGQAASFALGQPAVGNLTSHVPNYGGVSGASLAGGCGIFSDGAHLLVGDVGNARVLVWSTLPTAGGQSADFALGQPAGAANLTANAFGVTSSTLAPTAVSSDGSHLFVVDTANNRALVWSTLPTRNGQPADFALGQPGGAANLTTNTANNGGISGASMSAPHGISSDGAHLFVSEYNNNRILVWKTLPTTGGQPADFALGQPAGAANLTSTTANNGGVSGSSVNNPVGVFSDGTHLFVADQGNSRILVWNTIPTTGGQAADFALGQPGDATNLTANASNNGGVTGSSLSSPFSATSDQTHLYVCDSGNSRVLVWNAIPTTGGHAADFALGQPAGAANLTANANDNGGISGSSLFDPSSAASDGMHLYVADFINSRVLVWNSIPTTGGQSADSVFGQPNLSTNAQNAGSLSTAMGPPFAVAADGTRVFVADTTNLRVLIYPTY